MARHRIWIAAGAVAALVACSESREEKFERALRVAESAQQAVAEAEKHVAASQKRFDAASEAARDAEEELSAARGKLDAATASLHGARAEVAKWADDATVFRVVQQRLLEDRDLAGTAVSARVEQGVALLEGHVETEAQRDRAVAIARETPGVADVQSRLTVGAAAPPPAPTPIDVAPPALEPAPAAIDATPGPESIEPDSIDPAPAPH